MIHWGHDKHFICPVHSSDRRVPTKSGSAVDLLWDFTITFVQRTPNCCTNNRRPPLNLAAVDVLLGVVFIFRTALSLVRIIRIYIWLKLPLSVAIPIPYKLRHFTSVSKVYFYFVAMTTTIRWHDIFVKLCIYQELNLAGNSHYTEEVGKRTMFFYGTHVCFVRNLLGTPNSLAVVETWVRITSVSHDGK
ncbi:hypothetical protein BD560DRAFT_429825 [Blakeslea trispora]|nr:hypothetical protein BD560DRAFT_429825 [Blakeslea trispora]